MRTPVGAVRRARRPSALAALLLAACAVTVVRAAPPPRQATAATDTRALPRSVDAALARHGVPRDAMVAWVQEVDAARPRLAWQADKAVNPASLMKLGHRYTRRDTLCHSST